MVAAIQPGAKLGPMVHIISFMANWPPWVFYGIHAMTPPHGLRPYAAVIGLLGQFSTSRTPRPSSSILGLGGPLQPLRPMGRGLRSISHGPRSVGHLGPFWPNPMRPKGASNLGPKARWVPNHNWAHLSHFLVIIPLDSKVTKNPMDTILAINPVGPNFGHGPP
ncbi:hypothetical protein O181_116429 [Austropuccinia psidii MF-1]|uniref:Uncharacterized protein n=1 Tax=Austropuccinia psidii MF-1 TaxID=1389203 RepID=A0A9Q3KBF9_9BASI|nr:hypothetical protein [Austropuccinia psidii MF-1]